MTSPDPPVPEVLMEPARSPRLQLPLLVGVLVGITLACAYGFTLAPTIWAGDAGELITAAYGLGVPHAPGYPLWTMLGYVFSHLPIGPDPAWRLNFMTALFAWGACLLVYKLLLGRGLNPIWAGVVVLGLGVGRTFWANAVVAEVYSLNVLLLPWFWLLLAADLEAKRFRWSTWLVAGLACTAHQTSAVAAFVGLWALTQELPGAARARAAIRGIVGILAACTLYLYTFIAAQRDPLLVFGDLDTLGDWLLFTLLPAGRQVSEGTTFDHLAYFGELLFGSLSRPSELGLLPAILGLTGLAVHLRRRPPDPVHRCWAVTAVLYVLLFWVALRPSFVSLPKLDPYYLPAWVLFWLLVPEGYHAILAALESTPQRSRLRPLVRPVLQLLVVLAAIVGGVLSADANNRAGDTLVRESYAGLLSAAPDDAVLLCNFDDLFPLWYLQRVEGHRQDVVPVLVYFPDARAGSFWSRWIFEELATDHPALTVPPDDGTDLPLRLRNYIAQVRRTRPVLITFYDPGYGAPLYPPFDFRALGVGWMPRPFAFEAVGGEVQHTEEDLVVTLQQAAAWYEQGEQGAEVYSRWWARYHDSYEQGYLLARYMVGMVASADLLAQMGRGGEALAMYDRVLAIAPGVLENYRRAVAVARSAGDLPRAERYQAQLLDAVQAFGNINDDAVYLQYLAAQLELARIKVQAGDRLGALAIVQGILRQDPTNAGARRMLEELTAEG